MLNDLGSGSNVDLCVITKDGVEYLRNYEYLQAKTYSRKFPVKYAPGTASEYLGVRMCVRVGGWGWGRCTGAWAPGAGRRGLGCHGWDGECLFAAGLGVRVCMRGCLLQGSARCCAA